MTGRTYEQIEAAQSWRTTLLDCALACAREWWTETERQRSAGEPMHFAEINDLVTGIVRALPVSASPALSVAPAGVPDGWKLVPIIPDNNMVWEGYRTGGEVVRRIGEIVAELDAAKHALSKCVQALDGGWRPIASAPKNALDVWIGTKTQVLLGYYSVTGHGWYSSDSNFPIGWAPTHWQPHVVPAPPEE